MHDVAAIGCSGARAIGRKKGPDRCWSSNARNVAMMRAEDNRSNPSNVHLWKVVRLQCELRIPRPAASSAAPYRGLGTPSLGGPSGEPYHADSVSRHTARQSQAFMDKARPRQV